MRHWAALVLQLNSSGAQKNNTLTHLRRVYIQAVEADKNSDETVYLRKNERSYKAATSV